MVAAYVKLMLTLKSQTTKPWPIICVHVYTWANISGLYSQYSGGRRDAGDGGQLEEHAAHSRAVTLAPGRALGRHAVRQPRAQHEQRQTRVPRHHVTVQRGRREKQIDTGNNVQKLIQRCTTRCSIHKSLFRSKHFTSVNRYKSWRKLVQN